MAASSASQPKQTVVYYGLSAYDNTPLSRETFLTTPYNEIQLSPWQRQRIVDHLRQHDIPSLRGAIQATLSPWLDSVTVNIARILGTLSSEDGGEVAGGGGEDATNHVFLEAMARAWPGFASMSRAERRQAVMVTCAWMQGPAAEVRYKNGEGFGDEEGFPDPGDGEDQQEEDVAARFARHVSMRDEEEDDEGQSRSGAAAAAEENDSRRRRRDSEEENHHQTQDEDLIFPLPKSTVKTREEYHIDTEDWTIPKGHILQFHGIHVQPGGGRWCSVQVRRSVRSEEGGGGRVERTVKCWVPDWLIGVSREEVEGAAGRAKRAAVVEGGLESPF